MTRRRSSMEDMKPLVDLVRIQVETWLNAPLSPVGKNAWVEGAEGKAYLRYNAKLERLDLASIELRPRCRRKGTSKQILAVLCATSVQTVLVEQIMVPEWAKKLAALRFDGRATVSTPSMGGLIYNIKYIRRAT